MQFKEISTISRTEAVVEQIKNMISSQQLKAGDLLPSERKLCELLGVSRTVVREATNRLVEMGIIRRKPGRGSFVEELHKPLGRAMDLLMASGETNMSHVIEIRRILETEAARLAAERADAAQIAEIHRTLLDFEKESGLQQDQRFHLAVANATGNPLFAFVLDALLDMVNNLRRKTLAVEEGVRLACITHRKIYEAIAAHDQKRAVEMIRQHLDYAEALSKSSLEER